MITFVWEWVSPDGSRHVVEPNLEPTIWPTTSVVDIETGARYLACSNRMHRIEAPDRLMVDCPNCGQRHLSRYDGWPDCDPDEPHRPVVATGSEGRCLLCGVRHG